MALLVVRSEKQLGIFLPGGELLVDLDSKRFFTQQTLVLGPSPSFEIPVPADPALAGTRATIQGALLGTGYTLCNGYDVVVGY